MFRLQSGNHLNYLKEGNERKNELFNAWDKKRLKMFRIKLFTNEKMFVILYCVNKSIKYAKHFFCRTLCLIL